MLIREKDRLALLDIFASANVPFEVWAYGSRVNGDAHSGSDLDLVIRSHDLKRIPAAVFGSLYHNIKESNIPILVELKDWALLPSYFHANIERKYEVLFDNRSNFVQADIRTA